MRHPIHDYAGGGGYFITFATYGQKNILGRVSGSSVHLSEAGMIVNQAWNELPARFPGLFTDVMQIMPNHVHCILFICSILKDGRRVEEIADLRGVMHWFKGWSARQINLARGTTGTRVWQQGYYDRVIRSEGELEKFRNYLQTNPLRKAIDHGQRSGR